MLLALHQGKTLRGSYFPYFGGPCLDRMNIGEIEEIGTLSWFWHFTLRGNRGNRDAVMVLAPHQGKTMRGSLFPLFWWSMS